MYLIVKLNTFFHLLKRNFIEKKHSFVSQYLNHFNIEFTKLTRAWEVSNEKLNYLDSQRAVLKASEYFI
jgi:hypothetical protein